MPDTFFRFFNESSTAMAIADINGVILAGNGKFNSLIRSLSGAEGESAAAGPVEISGSSVNFLSIYDSVRFSNLLSQLSSGAVKSLVFRAPFRDCRGRVYWFKLKGWIISEEAAPDSPPEWRGPLIGVIIDDETREQETEEKLLEDKQIAEQAMEAKSRFLATMSHEIRTPIQTIIGMAELLQETKLNHEQAEYVRQEKFSAEVLLALINDILDFSKIEAGKMGLERIEFDLAEAVEQAVQMISLEAYKKDLEIAAAIPPETRIRITGDPVRFRQVLINLVKNAVKFTSQGSVVVSVSIDSANDDKNSKNVTVKVADTGIGVPQESRSRLFSSFIQADASHTRRFGGTGLGLVISQRIVEMMGGTIGLEPNRANESGGSVFWFNVPVETASGGARIPVLPEQETVRPVLLVDDSDVSRNIITAYLRNLGFIRIDTASSGEEALFLMRRAAMADASYRLCFIDMNMVPMDGWRLAAEITKDASINKTSLVLMVPQGRLEGEAKMLLLKWFNGYVNKPVTLRGLYETAAAALAEPETLTAAIIEENAPLNPSENPEAEDPPLDSGGLSALTVLVVEDHEINRKLFNMMLEKLGVTAILAENGLECLEKAAAHAPDIILMDLQMPFMNGFETAAELRRRGFDKPVIALTAGVLDDEQKRCLESGFNDILFKPCKKPEIEAILKKWRGETASAVSAPLATVQSGGVFNESDLLQTFMGDEKMAQSLLEKFLRSCGEQIASLAALEAAENWEEARRAAHTIKGSALNFSGAELGAAASRLEIVYKNALDGTVLPVPAAETQAAREHLAEAFARFREAAEAFLNTR